jgi:hypothetical protein
MAKQKKEFDCTIDRVLFMTFKMLRRYDDAALLTEQMGFSRPTIDKALNYGHVRDITLEKALIEFYKNRATEQKAATKEIINILKF